MAKRPPQEPPRRELSLEEKRGAITRLEARIKDIRDLDTSAIVNGDDAAIQTVEARIRSTLASIYGEGSAEYGRLRVATNLDGTAYVLSLMGGNQTPVQEIREGVKRGKERAVALLQGEVDSLKESVEFSGPREAPVEVRAATSNEIFIVHGRDEAAKAEVERVVQRAGLKPVILHQQANQGKTIIEKFEHHGTAAGFAIAIVTPDDVGGSSPDELKARARQNVIGEMFWFAGRLGRDRVCILIKGDDIEMPSDFAGDGYTPMDSHGGWKSKLLTELDAAGYKGLNWKDALA